MAKKKKKRNVKREEVQSSKETPIGAMVYTGPLKPGWALHANHTTTLLLVDNLTVASSGAGIIADVYGTSPSGCPNWGDTIDIWGEYRTLAMRVRFFPANRYSKTTTTCLPGVRIVDRRSATALASLDAGCTHETAIITSLEDPWRSEIRMNGAEEAQFMAVSGPTSFAWVKLYFTGLSLSATYGTVFVEYLVQFRNVE
jgi:hypothetical protein